MTDKELIKQEIERLKHTSNAYDRSRFMLLLEIEEFINSLPKESGCEVNFTTKSEDLEEAMELSVSEEPLLEFFATGQPTIGAYNEDSLRNQFEAGAEWQKQRMKETLQTEYEKGRFDMREEMMKDAVEGTVKYEIGSAEIPQCDRRYQVLSDPTPIANAKLGDKVKIIIVKE